MAYYTMIYNHGIIAAKRLLYVHMGTLYPCAEISATARDAPMAHYTMIYNHGIIAAKRLLYVHMGTLYPCAEISATARDAPMAYYTMICDHDMFLNPDKLGELEPVRNQKSGKPVKKIRLTALLLALFLFVPLFLYDQNNRIDAAEITAELVGLPDTFDGFRIVQVSDLHGKEFGKDNEILLQKIREAKPDIIVITGDMIDDAGQYKAVGPLAAALTGIAPAYFVTGNHEWAVRQVPALIKILEKNGVNVLRNEYVTLERGGETLVLAGIDDPNGPADQKTLAELTEEIRAAQGDSFIVLLAHRNNEFEKYAENAIPLTLTGHGHGGLIRLPFTDGLISTERTLFPSNTNGLYVQAESTMVVSRGLGNVGRTLRLFNRPHLPTVVLTPGAKDAR